MRWLTFKTLAMLLAAPWLLSLGVAVILAWSWTYRPDGSRVPVTAAVSARLVEFGWITPAATQLP